MNEPISFPRRVLVTGGAGGIGWAITHYFASNGCAVTVVDTDTAAIQTRRAQSAGQTIQWVADDITREGLPDDVIADVGNRFGGLDVLVNCAAISRYEDLLSITPESWSQMITVNLSAAFFWSQAAARTMCAAGIGRIVNICSVNSFAAEPRAAHYVASKAGLLGLTKAFAVDLAGTGVTVNAICPGPIGTEKNTAMFADEPLRTQLGRVPVGRLGTPSEVAAAVSFLASADASFINGHALVVYGGALGRI
jgi:3-oxoacyl-[acyl-carrier protein] reductase